MKGYMLPYVQCSTIYNIQDRENNLNVHKQMNGKRKYGLYTHNKMLTITKNETVSFAVTWMDLEIIILSKVS